MNPFIRVIEALNKHDVRYVIVGGFAAYMHGTRRVTVDLDVIVDLHPAEAKKAVEAVRSAGLTPRLPVDPMLFADVKHRESWIRDKNMMVFSWSDPRSPGFAVDFFVELPDDFESLYERSLELEVRHCPTRICGLDDLIAMKERAGRPQDGKIHEVERRRSSVMIEIEHPSINGTQHACEIENAAELLEFLRMTPDEKFELLVHALEFADEGHRCCSERERSITAMT